MTQLPQPRKNQSNSSAVSRDIARKVRAVIAEERYKVIDIVNFIGSDRWSFRRRLIGEADFTAREVRELGKALDLNPLWLMGVTTQREPYPGSREPEPDPTESNECAVRDLNPEPADCTLGQVSWHMGGSTGLDDRHAA